MFLSCGFRRKGIVMAAVINIFDKYRMVVPEGLKWHSSDNPGPRSVFITDQAESFTITFEEGMQRQILRNPPRLLSPRPSPRRLLNLWIPQSLLRKVLPHRLSPLQSPLRAMKQSIRLPMRQTKKMRRERPECLGGASC